MRDGFITVAVAAPEVTVADTQKNTAHILRLIENAVKADVRILVLPELVTTGLSCGDLFFQEQLQRSALVALERIIEATQSHDLLVILGSPLVVCGALYNCAAVIQSGKLLGIVPKEHLLSPCGIDQRRWFVQPQAQQSTTVTIAGQETCFGTNLLFSCTSYPSLVLGCEVGTDLYHVTAPSSRLTVGGASVIANPAVINELVGTVEYQELLAIHQSAKFSCAYLYSGGGAGESTTDFVYAPHAMITENGRFLAKAQDSVGELTIADIDLERLALERRRRQIAPCNRAHTLIPFSLEVRQTTLRRVFNPHPFIPEGADRAKRLQRILEIQSTALAKRLEHTGLNTVLLGLSGGLDSTLALLVCLRAFERLSLDRSGIRAISMPAMGTSDRTRKNAEALGALTKVHFETIDITEAVMLHFRDIGHDPSVADATYENSQARERTQILMDLANKHHGLVIGTGDMSELALGWATYNGDQMSMYAVNTSVAKTLVRELVSYEASIAQDPALSALLQDIVATPVSPELLPSVDKEIVQRTEDVLGPYEVHDFFLYYILRWNFAPQKILRLAQATFKKQYSEAQLREWLETFYRRFFSQQFKRSAMPDGPKIGSVSLSPRSSLQMSSDSSAHIWLEALDTAPRS